MSSAATPPNAPQVPAEGKPHKMKFTTKLVLIITVLALMAFLRVGFVFIIIGMLPTIVVHYLDRTPNRYHFRTIFACNLAGTLPFIGQLLKDGPGSSTLQHLMSAPSTWIIMYGAALMGVILLALTPQIAQSMIGSLHQTKVSRLQKAQSKIEQEWGKEVTYFNARDVGH